MTAVEDVSRMLTLVPWLLERPGASIAETAETFGVDPQRIRRDLYHLDFCGLPGLGGGALFDVTIVDDRVIMQMADELRRPLRLTPREALRLALTVEAVAETFGEAVPALRRAAAKVRRAAGIPQGLAVELAAEGSRWLGPVRQALTHRRRVRLEYQGRSDAEPATRLVDPWVVRIAEGTLYLQGHDHGAHDLRTFRLDRIADLEVLTEPSSEPPPQPLPAPRYVPTPDDANVELVVSPRARWLVEVLDVDAEEELPDGKWRVQFRTDALPWVVRLLLVGGDDVDIVAPRQLRELRADQARRALAHYHPQQAARPHNS